MTSCNTIPKNVQENKNIACGFTGRDIETLIQIISLAENTFKKWHIENWITPPEYANFLNAVNDARTLVPTSIQKLLNIIVNAFLNARVNEKLASINWWELSNLLDELFDFMSRELPWYNKIAPKIK